MTSVPAGLEPITKLPVGWPLPIVLAASTVGFFLAWRFLPVGVDDSVTVLAIVVGLAVGGTFVSRLRERAGWTVSKFASVRQQTVTKDPARAKDLRAFEQMFAKSMVFEHHLYIQLRPRLRYLAWTRLAARGIDLDHDPRAQELLGDLYELVHTRGAPPGALFGAGVSIELLEAVVQTLEQI